MTSRGRSNPVSLGAGVFDPKTAVNTRHLRDTGFRSDSPAAAVNNGQYFQFHIRNQNKLAKPSELNRITYPPESQIHYERRKAWSRGFDAGFKEALEAVAALNLLEPSLWHLPTFLCDLFNDHETAGSNNGDLTRLKNYANGNVQQYMPYQDIVLNAHPDTVYAVDKIFMFARKLQGALLRRANELGGDIQESTTGAGVLGLTKTIDDHMRLQDDSLERLSTIAEEAENRTGGSEDNPSIEMSKKVGAAMVPALQFAKPHDVGNEDCGTPGKGATSSGTKSALEALDDYFLSPTFRVSTFTGIQSSQISPTNVDSFLVGEALNNVRSGSPADGEPEDEFNVSRALFIAKRPSFASNLTEKPKPDGEQTKRRRSSGDSSSRLRNNPRRFSSEWRADLSTWRS